MTSLTAGARRSGTPDGSAQGAKAEAAGLLHVYCRAAPAFIGAPLAEQVESSYGQLGALLADLDVSPGDLVTERIFCRDLGRDHGDGGIHLTGLDTGSCGGVYCTGSSHHFPMDPVTREEEVER